MISLSPSSSHFKPMGRFGLDAVQKNAPFCFEPDGRLTVSHGVNKYATKAIATLPLSFEGYTDDLELESQYASFSFRPETAWFRSGSTVADRSVPVSSGKPSVTLGYA